MPWKLQVKASVEALMDVVHGVTPLSMETVGAAARRTLAQIGCTNPGWVAAFCCLLQPYSYA